jgi:DNA-directed RNA polymerase subunit L
MSFGRSLANTYHSPDVEFCAYAIPHPSEPKMNVRIQIWRKYQASSTTVSHAYKMFSGIPDHSN